MGAFTSVFPGSRLTGRAPASLPEAPTQTPLVQLSLVTIVNQSLCAGEKRVEVEVIGSNPSQALHLRAETKLREGIKSFQSHGLRVKEGGVIQEKLKCGHQKMSKCSPSTPKPQYLPEAQAGSHSFSNRGVGKVPL